MKKSKAITVEKAIDRYYNRHKEVLNNLYGGERQAKTALANIQDIPATRFNDAKNATKFFNEHVESMVDPLGYELKVAKAEAIINTPGIYTKSQQLNKKIDKNGFISHSKSMGMVNGNNVTMEGYYDISNSDYVLARMRYVSGPNTEVYAWEFVDKGLL